MHLSGLEIQGFKSFPRKTKLTFAPGVMAIVGPNGCGKTNIVDSVRWVLGEQRSSVLRSDKMENVIFAGSNAHKTMHLAEVTLVIENSHGVLPAEFTEVAITRRLYRTGESEYLINRRPSRLKDIRNLFADTGLGPDSYSIIELKMVEGILSSRTDERRRLFEEAAGVTLYKSRLKSAQLKLSATMADMVRLEDVLQEVTSRRNSLKRQVSRAKRYRHLREALRVKELTAAYREVGDLRARITPLEERLVRDRQTRETLAKSLEKGEVELTTLRGRLGALEEQLAELRKNRSEMETRSQALQREMVMLEERLRSGLRRGEERDTEEGELKTRRTEIAREIEELDKKREQAKVRDAEIRMRLEALDESWREYEERAGEIRRVRERQENSRREAERTQVRLDSEKTQVSERLKRIDERLDQLNADHRDAGEIPDTARLAAQVEQTAARLAATEEAIEEARAERETHREARASAENDAGRASRDLEAAKRRVQLLEGMVSGGEGRPKAVKALLSSGLKDIAGRLGDAVTVAKEWRIAVGAALEEVASAVITRHNSALKDAAAYLLEDDRGRGLLTTAEGNGVEPGKPSFAGKDGTLGPLVDKVKTRGAAGKAVERFLSRVWLVNDLDSLLALGNEAMAGGWTLVTPEGSRLTPDGLLAVGQTDPGDLGAAHMLDDARKELEECSARLEKAQAEIVRLKDLEAGAEAALEESSRQRARIREELDTARRELAGAEADLREYEALNRRRDQERSDLEGERENLNQRSVALAAELEVAKAQLSDVENGWEDMLAELETVEEEGRSLRSARDRLREQQVESSSTLERFQGEVRRQGALLDEIGRRLERIAQERKEAGGAIEDANERLRHVQAEDAVLARELEESSERLKKLQDDYNSVRHQHAERDGSLSEKRTELSTLSDRLHSTELEVSDHKHRMSTVRERILESYEIDLLSHRQEELPLAMEDDNPYREMPLGDIRDALRDIGPVNQMALEEYEIVDGRWQQLTEQHEDLTQAINTLNETIREINEIARERFLSTFTRVEGHFVSLFSRLFGGGEAALSLADGDPLEAGIQIYASPKGKKLSSIDLLSGGEKAMTAIALLFSLYLERPSPFCFLDEVDAPLDDVNVMRFNRLLREFTDRTQFLVVTHNKLTMERADRLYGVTMEEEGVSRMVAVEIGRKDREKVQS